MALVGVRQEPKNYQSYRNEHYDVSRVYGLARAPSLIISLNLQLLGSH
jgi:hypothetical protein